MIMSLPAMLATGDMERKGLLLKLSLFLSSAILSQSLQWNYWILLIARMCIWVAHSLFWAITASLVRCVWHRRIRKHKQLVCLAIGTSLATILGLPLGRLVGQLVGWRITFCNHCRISFGCDGIYVCLLPNLPSKNAGSLSSPPILAKRPLLIELLCYNGNHCFSTLYRLYLH